MTSRPHRARSQRKPIPEDYVYNGRGNDAPHVGADKLLTMLQAKHGDRRYECTNKKPPPLRGRLSQYGGYSPELIRSATRPQ